MPLTLTPSLTRRLIGDPAMAAKVLMGAEFDTFQRAKFRLMWFTPEYMDHSGVSVGKTELIFVWVFLRLMLLPLHMIKRDRVVFVYYLSKGTGERVFLPKVEDYLARSTIFRNELKRQRGGKFYRGAGNMFVIEMRNGGRCELPAGDFMNDSDNQASTRGNDLVLDEIQKIDSKGKGVDLQLRQRVTQECFNPYHPVHCNHKVYLGHAEDPGHPSHKRYADMRREYRRRHSQDYVTVTSSYMDFKGKYWDKYAVPTSLEHERDKRTMDPAETAQIYEGLWKRGSRGIYSGTLRDGMRTVRALPMLGRRDPGTIFSLGWDSAPGMQSGSDWNSGVIWAADEVSVITDGFAEPGYYRIGDRLWHIRAVFALAALGWDVDQRSGVIHRLDRAFGFSILTLDPGGGGTEIYKKLRERRQFIDNEWKDVGSGLCTVSDSHAWPDARPLVHFYDRGDPLYREEFGERYVSDQSGPPDFMHREVRGMMRSGAIAWPATIEERGAGDLSRFTPEQIDVLRELEAAQHQYSNIGIRLDKEKKPLVSKTGGFQMYVKTGKTDKAMASNYSLLGLIAKLKRISAGDAKRGGGTGAFGVFS
jgi:hypothetical protein